MLLSVSYSPGFDVPEELRRCLHRDDPVTRQDCIHLCDHIVNDWKMILRHLGVEEAVLENVDANNIRANEKSYQGLLEWTICFVLFFFCGVGKGGLDRYRENDETRN